MGETIKYVPLEIVQEHFEAEKGQDQNWFYNRGLRILVDIKDHPMETIELTPEQVEEFRTKEKRD